MIIKTFLQKPAIKQFIRFSLVGAFNTVLYYSVYLLLNRIFSLHYLLAILISFSISVTSSFILNKNWTFKNKDRHVNRQYIKFWIMALCGLGFNEGIVFLLVEYFGLYDLLAMAFAIVVVLFWNFFMGKYWVFKTAKDEPEKVEEVTINNL